MPSAPAHRILAIALGVLALAGAPGIASADSLLRVRLNHDILSTDPGTLRDENTDAVLLHVVEGLVAFRENGEVAPLLARSYQVSADGLTYTFHLRPGLLFHDGTPVTAQAVVWSLHRYLDPATHWRCLPDFTGHGATRIVSVTAADRLTATIRIDRPSALFLQNLARPDCGETAILSPASVASSGAWLAPIGTGPFELAAWQPGRSIDLVRFRRYASLPGPRDGFTGGKHALVERIRFMVIPDPSAAVVALASGAVDVFDSVPPIELGALERAPGVRLDRHPIMDCFAFLLQTTDPLLRDVRIRRAIALSLDTRAMSLAAMHGLAMPNNSVVAASSPFYDGTQAKGFRPDIPLAKKLLAQAGYHGQPIAITTNRQYPAMFDLAVLAQAMAQQAGIALRIEVVDWATQLDRYSHGHYQMMAFDYSARLDPSLAYDVFMGSKSLDPRKVWDDPAIESLLEESMTVSDPARRREIFDRLHLAMLQQVPLIALYNPIQVDAVRSYVVGFKGWPAGDVRLWDVGIEH